MSDKTNSDVEKALASFGTATLKYRSFGQPVMRPAARKPAALPDPVRGPALAAPALDGTVPGTVSAVGPFPVFPSVGQPAGGEAATAQPSGMGQPLGVGQPSGVGQPPIGAGAPPPNAPPPSVFGLNGPRPQGGAPLQRAMPPTEFHTAPQPAPLAPRAAFPQGAPPPPAAAVAPPPAPAPASEPMAPAAFPLLGAVLPQAAVAMLAPPSGNATWPPLPHPTSVAVPFNLPASYAGTLPVEPPTAAPPPSFQRMAPAAAVPFEPGHSDAQASPLQQAPAYQAAPPPAPFQQAPFQAAPFQPAPLPAAPQPGWPVVADALASPLAFAIEARMTPRERQGGGGNPAADKADEALGFTALGSHLVRAEEMLERRKTSGNGDRRGRDAGAPMAQQPGFAAMPADRRSVAEMFRVLAGRNERATRQDVFRPTDDHESALFRRL